MKDYDSTAVRISLYFALVWLAGGSLELLNHLHKLYPISIAGVIALAVLTAGGFLTITWTENLPLKLVAEPLTAAGVLTSAIGAFFSPYAWLQLLVGAIILIVFGGALYEQHESIMKKRQYAATMKKSEQDKQETLPFRM